MAERQFTDTAYRPVLRTTTVPVSVATEGPHDCGVSGVGAEATVFDAPGGLFVKRLMTITEGKDILTGGTPASRTEAAAGRRGRE